MSTATGPGFETSGPSSPDSPADPGPAAEPVVSAVPVGAPAVPDQTPVAPGSDPGPAPAPAPAPEPPLVVDQRFDEVLRRLDALSSATADQQTALNVVSRSVSELGALRQRDIDIADRMHAEITRLRGGELQAATLPLLTQLLRLGDQMAELSAPGDHLEGMRQRLLQILDTAAGVSAFTPAPGTPFDAKTMAGIERVDTDEAALADVVAACARPGFTRVDGSVLRAAEVAVHRYVPAPDPEPPAATTGTEAASKTADQDPAATRAADADHSPID